MRASRGVARALRLLGILFLIVALGLLYKQTSVVFESHQQQQQQQQPQRGRREPETTAACDVGVWAPWQQKCGADGMRCVGEREKAKGENGAAGMKHD